MLDTKMKSTKTALQFINLDNFVSEHTQTVEHLITEVEIDRLKYLNLKIWHNLSDKPYKIEFATNCTDEMDSSLCYSYTYDIDNQEKEQIANHSLSISKLANNFLVDCLNHLQYYVELQNKSKLDINCLIRLNNQNAIFFTGSSYATWLISQLAKEELDTMWTNLLIKSHINFAQIVLADPDLNALLQNPIMINNLIHFLLINNHYNIDVIENKMLFSLMIKAINCTNFPIYRIKSDSLFKLAILSDDQVTLPISVAEQPLSIYKGLHHLIDERHWRQSANFQIIFHPSGINDLHALMAKALDIQNSHSISKFGRLEHILITITDCQDLIKQCLNDTKDLKNEWCNSATFDPVINTLTELLDIENIDTIK